MTLTLSTGPNSGEVTVESPAGSHRVTMTANEEQRLAVALPAGARLVPLTIQSSVMFRPAEVNPSSTDMRGLGCQVRIALD